MADQNSGIIVKAGKQTYFFDVRRTKKSGQPFLTITESRFGKGNQRERATIIVFPSQAQAFIAALKQAVVKMTAGAPQSSTTGVDKSDS